MSEYKAAQKIEFGLKLPTGGTEDFAINITGKSWNQGISERVQQVAAALAPVINDLQSDFDASAGGLFSEERASANRPTSEDVVDVVPKALPRPKKRKKGLPELGA